jgi:phage N-6-adenine-methyltransferase
MEPRPSHGAEPAALPYSATTSGIGSGDVPTAVFPLAGESSSIDMPSSLLAAGRRRSKLHVHLSSKSGEWRTPPDLYRRLTEEFRFDLDVAATPENRLVGERPPGWDALDGTATWGERNYINPPYGREIGDWFRAAYWRAETHGATVVVLAPCRPDTRWWDLFVSESDEVRFIKGRLKFLTTEGVMMTSAPFPSCVVVYRPYPHFRARSPQYGYLRW